MVQSVHLVVLQHGMWGLPIDMSFLDESLKRATNPRRVVVLNSDVNAGRLTYDGLDVMGDRLAELVLRYRERLEAGDTRRVWGVSFVAYSLGGLITRYAIGKLAAKGFFACDAPHPTWDSESTLSPVIPVNFVTFASPHLGCWNTPDNLYRKAHNAVLPYTLSRTGSQLVLADTYVDGLPLLVVMADPKYAFHAGLALFQKRLLLANVRHDATVPFTTSSITRHNPYERDPGLSISKRYPCVVQPSLVLPTPPQSPARPGSPHRPHTTFSSLLMEHLGRVAPRQQVPDSGPPGSTSTKALVECWLGRILTAAAQPPTGMLGTLRLRCLLPEPRQRQTGQGSVPAMGPVTSVRDACRTHRGVEWRPVWLFVSTKHLQQSDGLRVRLWLPGWLVTWLETGCWRPRAAAPPTSSVQARQQGQLLQWLLQPPSGHLLLGEAGDSQPTALAQHSWRHWSITGAVPAVMRRHRPAPHPSHCPSSTPGRAALPPGTQQTTSAVVAAGAPPAPGAGTLQQRLGSPDKPKRQSRSSSGGGGKGVKNRGSSKREAQLKPCPSTRLRGDVFAAMLPLLLILWACMLLWLAVLSAHHYLLLWFTRRDNSWDVRWQGGGRSSVVAVAAGEALAAEEARSGDESAHKPAASRHSVASSGDGVARQPVDQVSAGDRPQSDTQPLPHSQEAAAAAQTSTRADMAPVATAATVQEDSVVGGQVAYRAAGMDGCQGYSTEHGLGTADTGSWHMVTADALAGGVDTSRADGCQQVCPLGSVSSYSHNACGSRSPSGDRAAQSGLESAGGSGVPSGGEGRSCSEDDWVQGPALPRTVSVGSVSSDLARLVGTANAMVDPGTAMAVQGSQCQSPASTAQQPGFDTPTRHRAGALPVQPYSPTTQHLGSATHAVSAEACTAATTGAAAAAAAAVSVQPATAPVVLSLPAADEQPVELWPGTSRGAARLFNLTAICRPRSTPAVSPGVSPQQSPTRGIPVQAPMDDVAAAVTAFGSATAAGVSTCQQQLVAATPLTAQRDSLMPAVATHSISLYLPRVMREYNWPVSRLCYRLLRVGFGWACALAVRVGMELGEWAGSAWSSGLHDMWETQLPRLAGEDREVLTPLDTLDTAASTMGTLDTGAVAPLPTSGTGPLQEVSMSALGVTASSPARKAAGGDGFDRAQPVGVGAGGVGLGAAVLPGSPSAQEVDRVSGVRDDNLEPRQLRQQRAMCDHLNQLHWHRADVDTRHYHAHAAIVVRSAARFAATHGHIVEYAIRQMRDI